MHFLLIPGAGTDPRVYDATVAVLRSMGHEASAPPLPLSAVRVHVVALPAMVFGACGVMRTAPW